MTINQEVQSVMDSEGMNLQDALEFIDVKNGGTGGLEAVTDAAAKSELLEAQAKFQEGDV